MTAKEQGWPELPHTEYQASFDGEPLYTADQMHKFREEGIAAALASDTGERGVVDAGFIEAAKCARRALARACTASPEYTRAYEQLDAAITAAALRAQPAGGGEKPWRQQRADEIEACIANGTMTVYQVFTQMRQLIATPPESGGQGVEAEGVMFGRMDSADFEADTITFTMEPGYYAAAGRYRIAPAAPAQPDGVE